LECAGGSCIDPCNASSCPLGYLCSMGDCQVDKCFGHDCGLDRVCDPMTGDCVALGSTDASIPDLSAEEADLSANLPKDMGGRGHSTSGCGCEVGAAETTRPWMLLLALM